MIKNESDLLLLAPHIHSKPVFIDSINLKAYFAQRFFNGETLGNILSSKTNPLTTDDLIQLAINLLLALKEQIHDKGIVHRDIKPENIIVDRQTLAVKIIDLGCGRKRYKTDSEAKGTPFYVAPEVMKRNKLSTSEFETSSLRNKIRLALLDYFHTDFVKITNQKSFERRLMDMNSIFDISNTSTDLDKDINARLSKVIGVSFFGQSNARSRLYRKVKNALDGKPLQVAIK